MSESFEQLVAAFKELMEKGEKDQWKLSEIAFLAGEMHGGIKAFADAVGYNADVISKYKKTYIYGQANQSISTDYTFAEAYTLATMSEDRAAALQILASIQDADGKTKGINTVRGDKEAVAIVQSFIVANPALMTEAMKDDATRSAIATQAYDASRAQVVAEAEGITVEAAGGRTAVEVDRRGQKAVRISQFLHGLTSASRGNGLLMDRWETEFDAIEEWMSAPEIDTAYYELGLMFDRIVELRTHVDAARKARV